MPRNAPGTIEAVIYFVNAKGSIIVAPERDHPTPTGFIRKEAKTLAEVDELTRKIHSQDKNHFDDLMEKDRATMRERRERIRGKLRQRMMAVDCSAFERQFIKGALEYLQKKEDDLYRYTYNSYFAAREFDSSSKDPIDNYGKQVQPPKMSDRLAALLTK